MRIQDPEEKLKARQDLVAGALGDKLKHLSKLVVSGQSYWLLVGKIPLAGVLLFPGCRIMPCTWLVYVQGPSSCVRCTSSHATHVAMTFKKPHAIHTLITWRWDSKQMGNL
jgi:hypothetical protein